MVKRITVTSESSTGRNTKFHDNYNGNNMTRAGFVKKIESGDYSHYHIRVLNEVKTPVSNPDKSTSNNLG